MGLLFWNKTELYGEGTLRSKNSHCVCLGFFGLSFGHLNIFPSECTIFITEFKIIYCLIWKIIRATINRNFKMLSNISPSGKNPTFLWLISTPKATSLLNKAQSQKNLSLARAEYIRTSIFGRMGYANIPSVKKGFMKTTKGETKKTIQNEGCTHLWRNNSTLLLLRRTLHWHRESRCPVLIKVCFTGLSSIAHYSGESGLDADKVSQVLKRTSKDT